MTHHITRHKYKHRTAMTHHTTRHRDKHRTAMTHHIARHEDDPTQAQKGYPLRAAVKLMAVRSVIGHTHPRSARAQVVDVVTAGDGVTVHHVPVQQSLGQVNLHNV